MALAAAQVVDAIAARLAPTANAAYTDRAWPIDQTLLPVWKVYATDESVESLDTIENHDLIVEARGLVAAVTGLDDVMNALAAAGLTAVHANPIDRVTVVRTLGISRGMAGEGAAEVGVVTIRFRAAFYTQASAPETLL